MHRKDIKGLKNRKHAQIPWSSSMEGKTEYIMVYVIKVWIICYVHEKICRNSKQEIRDSSLDLEGFLLYNIKKNR